jgi:putative ABC transport system permease protein
VLATLVGGRVLAQTREIGVLKATGLTPGQVTRLLVTEQLSLAAVGVGLGIGAGYLCTPLFATRSASLLNAAETPAFDAGRGLVVATVVLALVATFTFVPALRAARRSTAGTLAAGKGTSRRRSSLGKLVDDLGAPVPVSVGARGSFVHRGRTLLTALSLALTVAAGVATLGVEASLDVATTPGVAPLVQGGETPLFDPVDDDAGEAGRLRPIVYSFDAVLLFVGLVNLAATLLLTTRERVRDLGMLKAVGLTPRQVSGSLVSEQVVVAVIAGVVGLPLGLGLFRLGIGLAGSTDEFAYPSWWSLLLLVPGIVVLVAAIATPLARRAASLPVADALRFE